MICDTLQHLQRYKGLHPNLDTALAFLQTHDVGTLPLGRTEVDGEKVFINVMDAQLTPEEAGSPEYHKKYADLQLDLTGGEGWGYASKPGPEVKPFSGDIGFQQSKPWAKDALSFSSRASCTGPVSSSRTAKPCARQS